MQISTIHVRYMQKSSVHVHKADALIRLMDPVEYSKASEIPVSYCFLHSQGFYRGACPVCCPLSRCLCPLRVTSDWTWHLCMPCTCSRPLSRRLASRILSCHTLVSQQSWLFHPWGHPTGPFAMLPHSSLVRFSINMESVLSYHLLFLHSSNEYCAMISC